MAPVQEREEVSKFHLLQSACVSFLFLSLASKNWQAFCCGLCFCKTSCIAGLWADFAVFIVRKFPHRMDSFRIQLGVRVSVLAHWC